MMGGFIRRVAAIGLLGVMLSTLLAAPQAEAQVILRPLKVVLIGDSYAAGNGSRDANGNRNYEGPKDCYRSPTNWASQYVDWLETQGYNVTFVNRACSGGVVSNFTTRRRMDDKTVSVFAPPSTSQDEVFRRALEGGCRTPFPADEEYDLAYAGFDPAIGHLVVCTRFLKPQLDAVGPDTDLVLMAGGGNDVEFSEIVKQCFAPVLRDPGSCRTLVEAARTGLDGVRIQLTDALTDLRSRARPDTKVALIGYPFLANNDDFELVYRRLGLFESDRYDAARQVRLVGLTGDEQQQAAVANANAAVGTEFATFVNIKDLFRGHEPKPELGTGNPDRWMSEIENRIIIENYHYNAIGHQQLGAYLRNFQTFGATGSGGVVGSSELDLAFVVDTTGSMGDDINAVKSNLNAIVDQLEASTASYRIAVIDYRDFPDRTGDARDYPARVALDFSSDTVQIRNAINGLNLGFGGDGPETMWSGLVQAMDLDWRPGVKKVALQFGDAPALNPEPQTGYTTQSVINRSLAVDPVAVYGIDTGATGASIREVATATGGLVLSAPTPEQVVTQIQAVIDNVAATPYTWVGDGYAGLIGDPVIFDGSGSYDTDGEIVSWEWDTDGDGSFETTTAEPRLTHTYTTAYVGLVTLRTRDDDGLSGLATAPVDVSVDGDSVAEADDNCPAVHNPGQEDEDGDGIGDLCDADFELPTGEAEGVGVAIGPAPVASIVGGPYAGEVGQPIPIVGQASDPRGEPVRSTWYPVPGCSVADAGQLTTTLTCTGAGTYELVLGVDNERGGVVSASTTVTIMCFR